MYVANKAELDEKVDIINQDYDYYRELQNKYTFDLWTLLKSKQ